MNFLLTIKENIIKKFVNLFIIYFLCVIIIKKRGENKHGKQ